MNPYGVRRQSEAATALWMTPRLALNRDIIIVEHLQFINLECINRFHLCGSCGSFKPTCRTPQVLIRDRDQAVLHRILMHVVQPGKIRLLVGKSRLPEVVPNFPARRIIKFISPLRSFLMQQSQHPRKTFGTVGRGRMGNKVIVIRKNCPGLQVPTEIASDGKQSAMQNS